MAALAEDQMTRCLFCLREALNFPHALFAVLSSCCGSFPQSVWVKEWITRGKLNSFVLLHFLSIQRESITPDKENRMSISVA